VRRARSRLAGRFACFEAAFAVLNRRTCVQSYGQEIVRDAGLEEGEAARIEAARVAAARLAAAVGGGDRAELQAALRGFEELCKPGVYTHMCVFGCWCGCGCARMCVHACVRAW
jgi:hypothetical protein